MMMQVLMAAGFQVRCLAGLPEPDSAEFPFHEHLSGLTDAIEDFKPHSLISASRGGAYMMALWNSGLWTGPTVFINKHPSLAALPKDTTVVLCHGSNDELYQCKRSDLENLIRTGTPNHCLLFYTSNSGLLRGGCTKVGDSHNMASMLTYDCLPRLLDASVSGSDPELHLMRSWNAMVSNERLQAESWLGFSTPGLRRFWQSSEQQGMDDDVLFPLEPGSEEYEKVEAVFRAEPTFPRAYGEMNPGAWDKVSVLKIERVENGLQEDGNAEPFYKSMKRGIENQGIDFVPGVHTRWLFHGSGAIQEIVSNPISGFQPLMSGSRAASLWGPGTYFARDAKYVYDGGFCGVLPDGSKQLLMCLVMTGMTCLGDPTHPGVLPVRHGRHRYNSSVDSLSNPEIFVTQSPGAAYPAYVITCS